MRAVFKVTVLVLALCLWANAANAATDFQLWMEGGLRYRFKRNYQLRFDQHVRLNNNAQSVRRIMPEIALRYRVARWLRVQGGFRFIVDPREDARGKYADLWYRFFADAIFRYRLRPVRFTYRVRFQEQFGWPRDSGLTLRNTIRQRGMIAVGLGKGFEPYVSGEFFLRINDPNGVWHKWRATLGMNYTYKRTHEFTIFWRGEGKLDNPNDPTLNILGLGYHYHF